MREGGVREGMAQLAGYGMVCTGTCVAGYYVFSAYANLL